jgi:hypothetical protein
MEEQNLVTTFIMAFSGGVYSAWLLHNREKESRKALEADKRWGRLKDGENELERLNKLRKRMVWLYSAFIFVAILTCAYTGYEIAIIKEWF